MNALERKIESYKKRQDKYYVEELTKQGLDHEQIKQVLEGLANGIDPVIYAKKQFSANQMSEMRLGLQHGIDASLYADENYSVEQMYEFRLILEERKQSLNISKLIDTPWRPSDFEQRRR